MSEREHIVGVDENGLGPRLGPMIVTGVRLEVDRARIRDDRALRRITSRIGIGDSKEACAHGDMGGVESLVLAIAREHLDAAPATFTAFTERFCLDDAIALRRLCPAGESPRACFDDTIELPAFGAGPTDESFAHARSLRDAGVSVAAVRFASVCAKHMNVERAHGRSRFDVDLAQMMRLIASLAASRELRALCGKVGGRKSYAPALESLAPLIGVLGEKPERSSYRVPRIGEVHFVMDGDATEPAIGLASLFGKYVRELAMLRINRYWANAVSGVAPASGYHDPVTERLVSATRLARTERGIADECFER